MVCYLCEAQDVYMHMATIYPEQESHRVCAECTMWLTSDCRECGDVFYGADGVLCPSCDDEDGVISFSSAS